MSDNIESTQESTSESTPATDTMKTSEVESLCRHLGRSLKGTATSDSALAMHLMKESEHLKTNGFGNASTMFSMIAATLDPSLPIKMEIARRME